MSSVPSDRTRLSVRALIGLFVLAFGLRSAYFLEMAGTDLFELVLGPDRFFVDQAQQMVATHMRIIHPYGFAGPLPWQFGSGEPAAAFNAAQDATLELVS